MNILLIDDEELILQSLKFMINNCAIEGLNIYTAQTLSEAIKIAAFVNIDLAIVDIQMGADNGLDVINELQKLRFDCDYYLLSGYSEFVFAKRAIELQVREYLLKPITASKIKEICLKRLKRMDNIAPETRFKMSEMLAKGLSLHKMIPINSNYYYRTIVFISLDKVITKCPNEDMLKEMIDTYPQVSYVTKQVDLSLIVMLFSKDITILDNFNEILIKMKRGNIAILSDTNMNIESLQINIEGLRHQMIIKLFDNEKCFENEYYYLYKLLVAYYLKDTNAFNQQYVKKDDLLLIENPKIKFFVDKYSALTTNETTSVSNNETTSVSNLLYLLQSQLPQANTIQIEQVLKYIEDNYHLNISLEHMSSKFAFNPSYFSDWFKRQTGLKFIDYVTKLRIEKAKILLLNTNLTIGEITENVGYLSSSYFLKVFTKYEKQTPNNFRRKRKYD